MSAFEISVITSMGTRFSCLAHYVKPMRIGIGVRTLGFYGIKSPMSEKIGIVAFASGSELLKPLLERVKVKSPDSSVVLLDDKSSSIKEAFDVFINPDIEDKQSLMAGKVAAKSLRGYFYDEYGHKKTDDAWFKYLKHIKDKEFFNMLHYSDIICSGAGYPPAIIKLKVLGNEQAPKSIFEAYLNTPYGEGFIFIIEGVEWISSFDRDGFMKYLPVKKIAIKPEWFYGFFYRAIWKATLNRKIRVGDPNRFLSFGETYLDRMLDVDIEVDQLTNSVFKCFDTDSIKIIVKKHQGIVKELSLLKELSFEGQKLSKELLASTATEPQDMELIGVQILKIRKLEQEIIKTAEGNLELKPLIKMFMAERVLDEVKNLFPLAKKMTLSFEELYSRSVFALELFSGIYKNIIGDNNE